MSGKTISGKEAARVIEHWQKNARPVEVRLSFCDGVTQTHPGRVAVEPDGRIVVAHVAGRNEYLTTVLEIPSFNSIRLFKSNNALLFSGPRNAHFESVTIACRKP